MESQIERISPVECRVRVTIPWTDVEGRLGAKMRTLGQSVRLPGFRPGKVPPHMLERMVGQGARDELAREMVQETFQAAVAQHSTRPLTQPVVESVSLAKGEAFAYAARFEVLPEIHPTGYVGVPVRRRPVTVDPAHVEASLQSKRQELATLHPPAEGRTETSDGDVWTCDIDGTLGKVPVSIKDAKVEIGRTEGEPIPGLGEALRATQLSELGAVKALTFTPPAHRMRAEHQGQVAVLKVGLREVREKHLPDLDDEFARDTGEAESMTELRGKIEEKLRQEDGDLAERDARLRLVGELLQRNPFDPAPSLVQQEVEAQLDQRRRQLRAAGLTFQQIGTTEAETRARLRVEAAFNVRAFLLLDAIGKAEGVDVDPADVDRELDEMASAQGQNAGRLRAAMEKDGRLMLLRAQLREEKILDFLMSKAEVTEAPDVSETDPETSAQAVEDAARKAAESVGKASSGEGAEGGRRHKRPKAAGDDATEHEREGEPAPGTGSGEGTGDS